MSDDFGKELLMLGGTIAGFVAALRELNVTPHVAQNIGNRRSAIDRRTTRHRGYTVSQRIRKRIEEGFGWIKEIALQRRARHRGTERVGWQFALAATMACATSRSAVPLASPSRPSTIRP